MVKILRNVKLHHQVYVASIIISNLVTFIIFIGSPKPERANQPTFTKSQLDTVKRYIIIYCTFVF